MGTTEPRDPSDAPSGRSTRELARPPGERYTRPDLGDAAAGPGARGSRAALATPLLKAISAFGVGAALLFALGAIFASTAGLLFVAGLSGGAIGLLLARAAVPAAAAEPPLTRRGAMWLAVALSVAAVAAGAIATWLFARGEGGTLGLIDYLVETFGLFIPGEIVLAAIAAAWGAGAGPVER
jgi:hypothetical protein